MVINQNLCEHNWNFACYYQTAGSFKPKHQIVLFCKKCAKIKIQEAKE